MIGVDPWLERELRLVDRRGLLQGASLSQCQELGVEILLFLDGLVATQERLTQMVPWTHMTATQAPVDDIPEEAVWDTSEVVWESPTENEDDFAQVKRLLAQNGVSFAEGADPNLPTEPPVFSPEFDHEWV